MSLVIEIEAIGDQFFYIDLRRPFEGPSSAGTSAFTAVASPVVTTVFAVSIGWTITALPSWTLVAPVAAATLWTARAVVSSRPVFSRSRLLLLGRLRLGRFCLRRLDLGRL